MTDNETMIVSKAQAETMMHRIKANMESIAGCDQATKTALLEQLNVAKTQCITKGEIDLLNAYIIYTGELL